MKVSEVMTGAPVCCSSKTNLGRAAEMMWKQNCGILPIANIQNKVIGVVTDRDLFIALATKSPPWRPDGRRSDDRSRLFVQARR